MYNYFPCYKSSTSFSHRSQFGYWMYKYELQWLKMVAASSSEMREQITNPDGIITHKSALFNIYFNICTWKERTTIIRSRSQWPLGLRCRSSAARLLRLWVRIPPWAWMVVCCECCKVEISATDWSLVRRSPTDCGASLDVIKKPRKRGG
jgi:hypothetical protein